MFDSASNGMSPIKPTCGAKVPTAFGRSMFLAMTSKVKARPLMKNDSPIPPAR